MTDLVTVYFIGVNLCVDRSDHVLTFLLQNPVARIVAEPQPVDLSIDPFLNMPPDPARLIMEHFWRHNLDFTVLDIGANMGLATALYATFMMRADMKHRIYSFEPGPAFDGLKATIAANGIGGFAHPFNLALSDIEGHLDLHQFINNTSGASLLPDIAERPWDAGMEQSIAVQVTTIVAFVKKQGLDSNILCKIDTEGNDFRVINGAKRCIRDRLVPLLFEFTPSLARSYTDPVREMQELSADYLLIDERQRDRVISNFAEYVSSIEVYTDVIALPKKLPQVDALARRLGQAP